VLQQLPAGQQQQQQQLRTQPPVAMLQALEDLESPPPAAAPPDLQQLQQQQQSSLREALRQLDLAALMGGLRFRPWVNKLIAALDSQLQQLQSSFPAGGGGAGSDSICGMSLHSGMLTGDAAAAGGGAAEGLLPEAERPAKQRKLVASRQPQAKTLGARHNSLAAATAMAPVLAGSGDGASVSADSGASRVSLPPGSLTSRSAVVPVEHAPSMEYFMVHYLLADGEHGRRWSEGLLFACELNWALL
jgi:hypothetical protein